MQLKRVFVVSSLGLLTGVVQAATAPPASAVAVQAQATPNTVTVPDPNALPPPDRRTGSYEVGLMFGSQLKHNGLDNVSMEDLIRGLKDAAKDHVPTREERDGAVRFSRAGRELLAKKNEAAGKNFLKHNAKEEGVHVTSSGLQYKVLNAGDAKAASPKPTDQVTLRYVASLTDGTEFDRSEAHGGMPATFRVNGVLKGWQEALLAMKPGAQWLVFVPPELGYGANPPPVVPPGAVLVYQLELLHIDPAPTLDAASPRTPSAQTHSPPAH